jgi:hypothetical protein
MPHNRRTALQIAAQLPPEPQDALEVLAIAKEIVEKFFAPAPQRLDVPGGKRPRLRAISGPDREPK